MNIGNGEPFRLQELNAARSEGVGDEDVGLILESHESGVARCGCVPSVKCEETYYEVVFSKKIWT